MIATLPSSAQAQLPLAAAQVEPFVAAAVSSPVVGRAAETGARSPQAVSGFMGELQRLAAALPLSSPLFSQKSLAEQALRTSDDAKAPDCADEADRSEALLSAMQLPAMQLPAPQPLVAAPPVSPVPGEIAVAPDMVRVDSMVKTSSATLSGELASGMVAQTVSRQPWVTASPVLQAVVSPKSAPVEMALVPSIDLVRGTSLTKTSSAVASVEQLVSSTVTQMPAVNLQPLVSSLPVTVMSVPVEMALAPSTGLVRAASLFQTSRATASLAPLVGGTASSSTPPARAVLANSDALAAIGALSPEAAAVRERSTGHTAGTQTADSLAQVVSVPNSDASATQTASAHASGTATRTPQALVDALGERIEWQLKTGSERAVIRLDPPMQGQLEITIRRDAGVVQVHLSATHGDVVKQLQTISDTLRQELTGRQTGDVVVVVSQHNPGGRDGDGRGRQPGQNPEQAEPGRALAEAESGQPGARFALS